MGGVNVPRLVLAAPSSGSGKTTVATGLMAAFTEAGVAVSPHKVGPDYIDPGYHALATGRRGRNLDAYLCGPERVAPLFAHGAAGAQLAVVEGVMGLFDGAAGAGELASTAHVAKLLRAPVVLVVDASSQSRSVAALVHGFASWDPEVRVAGVLLNKVASDRHEELLRDAMEASGVPVLGVLRRVPALDAPSRHLGLVPVAERAAQAVEAVRGAAEQVRRGCDLDALLALARTAPPLPVTPWDAAEEVAPEPAAAPETASRGTARGSAAAAGVPARRDGRCGDGVRGGPRRPVVAVAGGPAFTFSYAEHGELLRAAGAEVAPFDPLRDEALPEGTRGIVIGGGFPEVYGPELSANKALRDEVAGLVAGGGPVAAECAGLLYLTRELDGNEMCGVLDATARMTERLTLGYREAVAVGDSSVAAAGARVRGHEFHRTAVTPGAGLEPAWGLVRPERRTEGFLGGVRGGVHASYLHVHWAASPWAARRFVERCAE
ncbi:hydrogenobyrinic acid a,c-diamide synthase (glutamine-hydrolysing) [Streptomyces sp. WMMB 714]|uniref:cobyrinate a,c-diamide synthase n=1 Tax=Streptomyces sp. WMMB 714 TaxID=1286822 RepID=UPI000823917C|nr:cobyrinate a,c-diamide synthase [Streptomyces sp. WMMB 714]SCK30370.1 hydrogenobyrinic acid a,c-diamide synthase (glutamine-hydrolysing) [Streptomyces sp. WMMB 714]